MEKAPHYKHPSPSLVTPPPTHKKMQVTYVLAVVLLVRIVEKLCGGGGDLLRFVVTLCGWVGG